MRSCRPARVRPLIVGAGSDNYNDYLTNLVDRFWCFRYARFANKPDIFDQQDRQGMRPPVFVRQHRLRNVLVDPELSESEAGEVRRILPVGERHRWFGSMKSSQALVQSVFGNLRAMKLCSALHDVGTDEGWRPFQNVSPDGPFLKLEGRVTTLGERRRSSIDISLQGNPEVTIECKLAESDVGHCSRPRLDETHLEHCDGSYTCQHGRQERCVLTTLGIKYWAFVPRLIKWRADEDHAICPMRSTYQLVRNVLTASIGASGEVVSGYAVLLFDERNPAFHVDGDGGRAFATVKAALLEPERLQRLSWQTIMRALRRVRRLQWLTSELNEKYGL